MNDSDKEHYFEGLNNIRSLIERGELQQAWRLTDELSKLHPSEELNNFKNRIEEKLSLLKPKADAPSVKTLTCPSCNSPLTSILPKAESLTCSACGSIIDLDDDSLAILGKVNPERYRPDSFISLGKIANFEGRKYQVVGRMAFSSELREWDHEDNAYCNETWKYDTWLLVDNRKKFLHLSEDAEGYSLAEEFTPSNPNIPQPSETSMSLEKDHYKQRIDEFATDTLEYFEGEFTWVPKPGDVYRSVCYRWGVQTYSVEWLVDPLNNSPKEIEFFRSWPVSRLELAKMFDERSVIEEEKQKQLAEKELKKWSYAFLGASLLLGLLFLLALVRSGETIASDAFNLSTVEDQEILRGPFELDEVGSIYRLSISADIPDNTSAWSGIELLDAEQNPVNALEGDFWRESGYDSDGKWSESDVSADVLFKLENPGSYYVRLIADADTAPNGTVHFKISKNIVLARYYLIGMLIALAYGLVIQRKKSLNPFLIFVGIVALGILIVQLMDDD